MDIFSLHAGYNERPAVPPKRPRLDNRQHKNRRPGFGSDPLGLSGAPMSYAEAEARGLAGDLAGIKAWAATFDGELPQDLMNKIRPARCDLCDIELSSTIVAKTHYFGKNHEKHTKVFFQAFFGLIHLHEIPLVEIYFHWWNFNFHWWEFNFH